MARRILFIITMLIVFTSCNNSEANYISIKNNSSLNITEKVISLDWKSVSEKFPWIADDDFKIINNESLKEIPYQLEKIGTETVQNILIQVSIEQQATLKLKFLKEVPTIIESKTFGRFVPERLDDFAWENDKIAFRVYGKALEIQETGNAYGIDVWVKRTNKTIINKRYKLGDYHTDNGDGLDYYHVGLTLGAGNAAPFIKDSIWYSKNYSNYKILDNGPLRTSFQLEFSSWNVNGTPLSAVKTITLDAGSQLNKIETVYKSKEPKQLPIAIGIVKRNGGKELLNKNNGILAYWEPTHKSHGTTGVGVIIPENVVEMKLYKNQFIAISNSSTNKPFVYYTGACWDKAGEIKNYNEWNQYLNNYKNEIENTEIIIKY